MIELWVVFGLLAASCFVGMVLSIKKLLTMNLNPIVLNLFLFLFISLGYIVWILGGGINQSISINIILLCVLTAVFAMIGNFCDINAIKHAPNPGYASTLKSFQIVIITLVSPILFNSSLSAWKVFGVFLVLFGVFLLSR